MATSAGNYQPIGTPRRFHQYNGPTAALQLMPSLSGVVKSSPAKTSMDGRGDNFVAPNLEVDGELQNRPGQVLSPHALPDKSVLGGASTHALGGARTHASTFVANRNLFGGESQSIFPDNSNNNANNTKNNNANNNNNNANNNNNNYDDNNFSKSANNVYSNGHPQHTSSLDHHHNNDNQDDIHTYTFSKSLDNVYSNGNSSNYNYKNNDSNGNSSNYNYNNIDSNGISNVPSFPGHATVGNSSIQAAHSSNHDNADEGIRTLDTFQHLQHDVSMQNIHLDHIDRQIDQIQGSESDQEDRHQMYGDLTLNISTQLHSAFTSTGQTAQTSPTSAHYGNAPFTQPHSLMTSVAQTAHTSPTAPGDIIAPTTSSPLRVIIPKLRVYECEMGSPLSPRSPTNATMPQGDMYHYANTSLPHTTAYHSPARRHDDHMTAAVAGQNGQNGQNINRQSYVEERKELFEMRALNVQQESYGVRSKDAPRKSIEEIKMTYQRIRDEVIAEMYS